MNSSKTDPNTPSRNAQFEPAAQSGFSRRDFLKRSAVAAGALAGAGALTPRSAPAFIRNNGGGSPPNFLFVITDQQVIDSIAAHQANYPDPEWGVHHVNTPHLDRMVNEGVSFLESYSTNPVCSPARSSMFTGRPTIETGVITNSWGIDADIPNIGEWMDSVGAGYRRVYCGKWHVPAGYPSPTGAGKVSGFEIIPVGGGGTGDFIDYQVSGSIDAFVRNYSGTDPFFAVASLMNPHDIAYVIAPWGVNFQRISVASEDTFRLGDALPPLPPNHVPTFTDPFNKGFGSYDNPTHWRNYIYDYYRMVEKVDHDIGRILDAVEARDDDTIVIFTSDHGEGLGRHGRVSKWHCYDHAMRVANIWWCPGRIQQGGLNTTHLVSGLDIVPTVCDFAGIAAPPNMRGRSLRPILEDNPPAEWRDNVHIELDHTGRVIRTDQYKYVMKYTYSGDLEQPFVRKSDGQPSVFVQGQGDLFQQDPIKLLFDIRNDPWEQTNLYGDPSYDAVVAQHEAILRDEWEANMIVGQHDDTN